MKVLAIDTATMLGGVAIIDSGAGLLIESRVNVSVAHSERVMAEVDSALGRAALTLSDLDALAVTSGPGSFTGLRIGLGTVKGLAYSTGLRVVTVPTLLCMAWNFPHSTLPVCVLLDARKGELYAGVFDTKGPEPRRLIKESALSPKALVRALGGLGKCVLLGQGAELYREELALALGDSALFAPPHLGVPSPAAAAHLGLMMAQRGEYTDAAVLGPEYMRKSEAELKRK